MTPRFTIVVVTALLLVALGLPSAVAAQVQSRQPLRFTTSGLNCSNGVCALAAGNVGANYGQNIAISGESGGSFSLPVFTVVVGTLPPGLFLPQTFGCCGDAIGGTPTLAGNDTFTLQVKDGAGDTARQAFRILVNAPAPLTITFPTTCCAAGTIGTSYLQNFFFSGGVGPYSGTISSGQLPPGLSLSAAPPMSITGTPTTSGTFPFTVTVTDSTGAQATELGSITVR